MGAMEGQRGFRKEVGFGMNRNQDGNVKAGSEACGVEWGFRWSPKDL